MNIIPANLWGFFFMLHLPIMKIHKLARQEAQKIAAGEVVERPANIIKELVENSLDAGATNLTITVKQAGKEYISISDNGSGMSKEDAQICFERHTTSKIKTIDQLQDVTTFGFRGEALASVCSVSRVVLTTKEPEQLEGIRLFIQNGKIEKGIVIGCASGTTIEISDLFYNVPARKKFLKTNATEWNHILILFRAFALNHLNVHFTLVHDKATVYNCPPVQTVTQRAEQIFDSPLKDHVISLNDIQKNDITISGAVTTQQYARYDRGGMFFFVNNRWVKNYQLANALTKGYLNVLSSGRYPAAVISLTVNPKTVDVNVHPKKEEIQFLNPRNVEAVLTAAVKTTLENYLSEQLKQPVCLQNNNAEPFYSQPAPFPPNYPLDNPFPLEQEQRPERTVEEPDQEQYKKDLEQPIETPQPEAQKNAVSKDYALLGQYKKTYLLLERQEGLFIIDQHAAHERILYEKFNQRFEDVAIVPLLFPHTITIAKQDIALLEPHLDLFESYGIQLGIIGPEKIVVKATPVFFKNQPVEDVIHAAIGWIKELEQIGAQDFHKKITEKLRAQMACKAAVKAGDVLTQETMEQLLTDLEGTTNRFTCPHGRPTSWLLPLNDLERKFKRRL